MNLPYTHMPLERCTNERKNSAWLKKQFNHKDTVFCLINDGKSFFAKESVEPLFIEKSKLATLNLDSCIYLGKNSDHTNNSGSFLPLTLISLGFQLRKS